MGCERFDVGHDVTMKSGGAWMMNGDERYVNGELVMEKRPGPPNSPSVGDNGTEGTARKGSMYASAQ